MAETQELLIVGRMRDEISNVAKSTATNVEQATKRMRSGTAALSNEMANMRIGLVAAGSALMIIGSLMNRLDNPMLKVASNFVMIAGGIINTVAAMVYAIPQITKLITTLRSLAIVQTIVMALSGPLGWAALAAAGGVAAAAISAYKTFGPQEPTVTLGTRTEQIQATLKARYEAQQQYQVPANVIVRVENGVYFAEDEKNMAKLADAITEAQRRKARGTVGRLP